MQIGAIGGLKLNEVAIERQYSRGFENIPIPGGLSRVFNSGAEPPMFTISGFILECNAEVKARQLEELVSNLDYRFVYIQFEETDESVNDGWFVFASPLQIRKDSGNPEFYPFELDVARVGDLSSLTPAQYWTAASETVTGTNWGTAGTLTETSMVSMPYNATDIDFAVAGTNTGVLGSNQILENPTFATLMYTPSGNIHDWEKAECRVYDTVRAGETTETDWVRVFDKVHDFTGDTVFQNGMMRYVLPKQSRGTFYAYDTTSAAWKTVGLWRIILTGVLETTVRQCAITELSPDEIRWFERRHIGANRVYVEYTLRRGAQFCRTKISTTSLGIDTASTHVQLYKAGGFMQLLNSSANGAQGAGALATDVNDNYHAAYNTTDDIVIGFALCDQPLFQPYDTSGDYLAAGLTWSTSTTRTLFIFAFPQETNPFVIATARTKADSIAAYCLKSVTQVADLVPANFKV